MHICVSVCLLILLSPSPSPSPSPSVSDFYALTSPHHTHTQYRIAKKAEIDAKKVASRIGLSSTAIDRSSLQHLLKQKTYVDVSSNASVRSQGSSKVDQVCMSGHMSVYMSLSLCVSVSVVLNLLHSYTTLHYTAPHQTKLKYTNRAILT